MCVTLFDTRTKRFFRNAFSEVGFIEQCHDSRCIENIWSGTQASIEQYHTFTTGDIRMRFYEVWGPRESVLAQLSSDDHSVALPNDQTATIYGVEWMKTTDNGCEQHLLLFRDEPTISDVELVKQLHRLQHDLRFGDIPQRFNCRDCGEEVHWLVAHRTGEIDPLYLSTLMARLERQRCGCDRRDDLE